MSTTSTISRLNDMLRATFATGHVMVTEGIQALPTPVRAEVLAKVRAFDDFGPDNDPHDEHDFGAFDVEGAGKVFWKIDYYDNDLQFGSPDPADPKVTRRVLTIMLATEY